jgi:hypothetical protein
LEHLSNEKVVERSPQWEAIKELMIHADQTKNEDAKQTRMEALRRN